MKKILFIKKNIVLLSSLFFVFLFVSSASSCPYSCSHYTSESINLDNGSFLYTETLDFGFWNGWGQEGPFVKLLPGGSVSYFHNTPSDFEVPFDEVSSASLEISGYYIDEGDSVQVNNRFQGELNEGGKFYWKLFHGFIDDPVNTFFDISAAFEVWDSGSKLDVSVSNPDNSWSLDSFADGFFKLESSVFTLEYTNRVAAHTPEGSTFVLLGIGLVFAFGVIGKKYRKV